MTAFIPHEIQDAIKKDRLIVFVGSGLSLKFNLPTWRTMIIQIISELDEEKYKPFVRILEDAVMEPLDVLEVIKNEHNKIHKYIETNFKVNPQSDFKTQKNIIELSGKIITTNYDNAFELASNDIYLTTYDSSFKINNLKDKNKFLFKLHGGVEDASKCVIFKDDYNRIYESETSAILKLKDFFINYTILFIGFSFKDAYVNKLFNHINQIFQENITHYILTNEPDKPEGFNFLKPIKIDDYVEVNEFLQHCLNFKQSLQLDFAPPLSLEPSKPHSICRIVCLYPEPVDIQLSLNCNVLFNSFETLNIEIYKGFLTLKTLTLLDDFDYVIILTKSFKGKIYIENDNLQSQLISYEELDKSILNENTIRILICEDRVEIPETCKLIKINSYKPIYINKVIYKTIRNNELNFVEPEITVVNIEDIPIKVEKGTVKMKSIYGDRKALGFVSSKINNFIIGRIEEQTSIAKRILNLIESSQILNIKGSGGIGKTSIIKKIGYDLFIRGYFNEGVTFRSCENVKSYDDFETELILGFKLLNIVNFKEYLHENNEKFDLLVILDNFETVAGIDDEEYEKIMELLEFSSDYANIIITSRESIGRDFEDVYTLNSLITDDAVKLFFRYYKEIVDVKELRILRTDILENLLNNNPLAIKLVTHNSLVYKSVIELKSQLEENFFQSTSNEYETIFNKDADLNIERTKSIYHSINYSYSKLKEKEKLAFEILHLFPDGIGYVMFKKWFAGTDSHNNIGDRELKHLQDKSLIENNDGILQLQPIIRRFAEYQFDNRDIKIKRIYYSNAYSFNAFILRTIRDIKNLKSLSAALKVYDSFKNNLSMVIDYVEYIDLPTTPEPNVKKYLLNYIYLLDGYVYNQVQVKKFNEKMRSVRLFFSDVNFANTLIDVMVDRNTYYFNHFDQSYENLSKIFPATEIKSRNFNSEDYVEKRYRNIISVIHGMEGHTFDYVTSLINDAEVSYSLFDDFFYLGITDVVPDKSASFYKFENQLMRHELNINELNRYIDSLFTDENLEILQCTYTLSKVTNVSNDIIRKLVVTNPYTKGLKAMMLAFNEKHNASKEKYFENALRYLSHIKYYYIEALFYYGSYLFSNKDERFEKIYQEGFELSRKFHYQYLEFKFANFYSDRNTYSCDYSYFGDVNMEQYLNEYNKYWREELRKIKRESD